MTVVALICAGILGLAGLLCLVRMVLGPTMLDRTVAADVFVATAALGLGVEAALNHRTTTVPILVVLAFVAFLGSVSIARFVARDVPEVRPEGGADE